MMSCTAINILDMIDMYGEDEVRLILSDFSCPKNVEVDDFVKRNAIEFAKQKTSITYLVMNDQGEFVALFTLTHKAVIIPHERLSSTAIRKLNRYAKQDETTGEYTVSAFLIAQFGKNYADNKDSALTGNELMENAMEVLTEAQHIVGGGVVYLECEDIPKLLDFYQNDYNIFRIFGERYSAKDGTKYIQLLRFF